MKQSFLIITFSVLSLNYVNAQWNGSTVATTTTSSSLGVGTNTPATLVDVQNITSIGGINIAPSRIVDNMYTNTTQTSPIYNPYILFEVTLKRIFDTYPVSSTGGNPFIVTENSFIVENHPAGPRVGINKATAGYTLDVGGSIHSDGNVIVGTVSSQPNGYRLFVEQGILTEKVKVAVSGTADWSDFVFDKSYQLRPISELEQFIDKNKHLPDVPSATEVVENGIDLAKMDATLLRKIEELTLYVIDLKKENDNLRNELYELKEIVK